MHAKRTPCACSAHWLACRPMTAKNPELTERFQFQLTAGERRQLEQLAEAHAAEMAAAGFTPDPSIGGYLRATIRRLAKEKGIAGTAPAPEPKAKRAKDRS